MWKEQVFKSLSYLINLECFSYLVEAYDQKENRYAMHGARITGIALGPSFYFLNLWFAIDYSVSKPDLPYAFELTFLLIGFLTLISLGIGTGILVLRSWVHSHGFINRPFQALYALLIAFSFEYLLLIPTATIYFIAYGAATSRITHGIGTYLDKFDYGALIGGGAIVEMDLMGNNHLNLKYRRRDEFDSFVLRSDMTASSYGTDFYSNKFLINRVKEVVAANFVNEKADPKIPYEYAEKKIRFLNTESLIQKPASFTTRSNPPIDLSGLTGIPLAAHGEIKADVIASISTSLRSNASRDIRSGFFLFLQ